MSDIDDVYPGPNNPDMFEEKMSDTNNAKESTGNERLPEQQCPVRVAENDLIAEQIARDARQEATNDEGDLSKSAYNALLAFGIGQDKIATNRTVEAVRHLAMDMNSVFRSASAYQEFLKELEKLRRV